jgi:arabinofuranosyltransferase
MRFFRFFCLFFLLLSILSVISYFYLGRPMLGMDDADIFLNYARRLAHGEGFVFNSGGEKVEGFTSILWVLICSLFYHITAHPQFLLSLFTLLLTTLSVTLVYQEVRKDIAQLATLEFQKFFLYIFCGYVICISPSFVTWSVLSLMENALWNFLFISTIILLLNNISDKQPTRQSRVLLLLLAPLLILTRPEAMAWTIFFTAALALIYRNKGRSPLFPLAFLAVAIITTIIVVRFRTHYFGYPLPNTYYAKVSPDRWYNFINGLRYAQNFMAGYNPFVTLLVLALLLILPFSLNRAISPRIILVSFTIWMGILLPVITGDDHFGSFRFYQHLLLPALWGLPAIFGMYNSKTRLYPMLIVLAFCWFYMLNGLFGLKSTPHSQLDMEFSLASKGKTNAQELNHCWEQTGKPSAAVIAVGGFALFYEGKTVDLMGLNDVRMGHSPGDRKGIRDHAAFNKDVFYEEQPDILLPEIVADQEAASRLHKGLLDPTSFENRAMKNIFGEPRFQNEYVGAMLTNKKDRKNIFFFCNTRFLPALQNDTSLEVHPLTAPAMTQAR